MEEVKRIIQHCLEYNKTAVRDYINGSTNSLNFIVEQVMKDTNNKFQVKKVEKIILKELKIMVKENGK